MRWTTCIQAILATLMLTTCSLAEWATSDATSPAEDTISQLDITEYVDSTDYQRPHVKFTLDALYMQRAGGGGSDPLILDAPFPLGRPLLTADQLDIDGLWGGRLELIVFDPTPNPTDIRFSYFWTQEGEANETRSSNPADIMFFNIIDAAPANSYTARLQSKFSLGDIGIRKEHRPGVGLFGGFAFGKLTESLGLLTGANSGFYSDGSNRLYGANFGIDGQLWSNGYTKIEGSLGYGVYYNSIEVNAQSQNWQEKWTDDEIAYMGNFQVAWVVPAYPFNFRIGYQAMHVGGLGLLADQSDALRLFDGGGSIDTSSTTWHGLMLGIEYLR